MSWLNIRKENKPLGLVIDSGAFSAWNKGGEIDLDKYIEFCLGIMDYEHLEFVVNLDVIPAFPGKKNIPQEEIERSARQGWENYQKLLAAGIPKDKVVHVFHQNENFEWLRKMTAEAPYIGLSPANDRTFKEKLIWLDQCMNYVLDDQGFPLVKFHGFAVTSAHLMLRYPWYSVDSASWSIVAGLGRIYIPTFKNGKWDYTDVVQTNVSARASNMRAQGKHVDNLTPKRSEVFLAYLAHKGYELGESEFREEKVGYKPADNESWIQGRENGVGTIEKRIKEGVCNSIALRCKINLEFFVSLQKLAPEWPWAFDDKHRHGGFGL